METVEYKAKLQLMDEGERLMFRNRGREGVAGERDYNLERGEMSLGGMEGERKAAGKMIDRIKTSRRVAGNDKANEMKIVVVGT